MTPQDLINAYVAECKRVNGGEYADLVRIDYSHGWYRLVSPRWYDGYWSPGSVLLPRNVRRRELEEMIERLHNRPGFSERNAHQILHQTRSSRKDASRTKEPLRQSGRWLAAE